MIKNQQPIEKRATKQTGYELDVHSIFYTIQGEGPFSGTPAVFVRLAGCNLQCPLCDTDYTEGRTTMGIHQIVASVVAASNGGTKLVVVTGGEPFRQQLLPLFETLLDCGMYVQVETNGTLPPPECNSYSQDTSERWGVYVVCSPKTGRVRADVADASCCFKYVMCADAVSPLDGLPTTALEHTANPILARPPKGYDRPVYLQPADEQEDGVNTHNLKAVLNSCMQYGYVLQLQIHKIINME